MELVIATSNVHKVREFRSLLQSIPSLDLLTLLNFPQYIPPDETGETFMENAILKAEHAAHALNKWVIADDSGLVVPTLQGAPGVRSKRYAEEIATDASNRKKLLKELEGFTDLQRSAYFECALALANPQGIYKTVSAICEGIIIGEERGRNGFGYDALFTKHDYGEKTFAELPEETKNRISHRGKALEKMRAVLESLAY